MLILFQAKYFMENQFNNKKTISAKKIVFAKYRASNMAIQSHRVKIKVTRWPTMECSESV